MKYWRSAHSFTQFCTVLNPKTNSPTKNYQPRLIRSPTNHDIRSQENPEINEKEQGPRHRQPDKWYHDTWRRGIIETEKKGTSWMERSQDDNTAQKGDMRDIKNYKPISLLSHIYKLFTRILKKWMGRVLDENQPREQAGFRKGYTTVDSTVDHLQTINQLIEKCNEFNRPLCIGYIDNEKAFDSIENKAIFKALNSIGINKTYITILEDTYTGATQEYIQTVKSQKKYQY